MAKDPNEIGALWVQQGPKGEYLTGQITIDGKATKIICFVNGYKTDQKHPDWRVLISKPKGDRDERDQASGNPHVAVGINYPKDDINPEDIPF